MISLSFGWRDAFHRRDIVQKWDMYHSEANGSLQESDCFHINFVQFYDKGSKGHTKHACKLKSL